MLVHAPQFYFHGQKLSWLTKDRELLKPGLDKELMIHRGLSELEELWYYSKYNIKSTTGVLLNVFKLVLQTYWSDFWFDLAWKKKCIPLVNAKHHFGGKYYLSVVIISLLSISLQSPGSLGWFSSVGVKNYSLIIPGLARTQAMLFHDATKTQTKAICPYNTLAEIFEVWVDSLWLMQWGAKKETERKRCFTSPATSSWCLSCFSSSWCLFPKSSELVKQLQLWTFKLHIIAIFQQSFICHCSGFSIVESWYKLKCKLVLRQLIRLMLSTNIDCIDFSSA